MRDFIQYVPSCQRERAREEKGDETAASAFSGLGLVEGTKMLRHGLHKNILSM